jgi:YtkA-like
MPRTIEINVAMVAAVLALGCGSSTPSAPTGPAGGMVMGAADVHCTTSAGMTVQPTNASSCTSSAPSSGPVVCGDQMYGNDGDDDDCKYHVQWTSTPIYENTAVSFTVTVTKLADNGAPVTGANTSVEAFLSIVHPAPPLKQTKTEMPPGTYAVSPVQFDAPGRWTVRFHFFETCDDTLPDSPHGHAAFYVDVP